MVPKHTVRWVWIAAFAGATVFWPESAAAVVDPVSSWNAAAVQATLTADRTPSSNRERSPSHRWPSTTR